MKNMLMSCVLNLNYVNVDRNQARKHWWKMVGFCQLSPDMYLINRRTIVSYKATAGILGHQQTRGFVMHRLRERCLLRRLATGGAS